MEKPPMQPPQPTTPREDALAQAEADALRKSIPTYEELLAEAEASMGADIEKWKEKRKAALSEMTHTMFASQGVVKERIDAVITENLKDALAFADAPDEVRARLLVPIVESVRDELSHEEGFDVIGRVEELEGGKLMAEQLRVMYAGMDGDIIHTAVNKLRERLQALHASASGDRKAKLKKVIAAIDEADPPMKSRTAL